MSQGDPLPCPATLRTSGAHRFDPVRFGYIESLQRRAAEQQGPVRDILEEKQHGALRNYLEDLKDASAAARAQVEDIRTNFPEAGEQAQALLDSYEFRQLDRLLRRLQGNSGASPLQELSGAISAQVDRQMASPELESTRQFRDSLARRKADRLVKHAALEAPAEPGPLNPQMLALRSLEVMRELSPAYLNRFVNYIDTLLWLQQARDKNS